MGVPVETPEGIFCLQKVLQTQTYICLDGDTIGQELVLRTRLAGDTLRLPRRVNKSVKKWMNEVKMPAAQRRNALVLADENGVIWVQHLGVDARCVPTAETRRLLAVRLDPTTAKE